MVSIARTRAVAVLLLSASLLQGGPVAHDESEEDTAVRETGWFNESEFSIVTSRGNVDGDTLGLKNKLRRLWPKARFQFRVEGVRSDSGGVRTAVRTNPDERVPDFRVVESGRVTDLDTWLVEARYDRQISPRTFWNAGASWDKNQSAGIESRYRVFATIGNIWWSRSDLSFNTSYGLSYTNRREQIDNPVEDDTFVGIRFDWGYRNKITKTSVYTNDFTLNVNIDDPDERAWEMTNAFTVGLSDRLAVRIGLQLLYNTPPALEVLPFCLDDSLQDCPGEVVTEKEPLDILFTTSLVVDF